MNFYLRKPFNPYEYIDESEKFNPIPTGVGCCNSRVFKITFEWLVLTPIFVTFPKIYLRTSRQKSIFKFIFSFHSNQRI